MTGTELKQRRETLGYSQEKLAQLLDVSLSTVARWEQLKEEQIPNSKMLQLAVKQIESETSTTTRNKSKKAA